MPKMIKRIITEWTCPRCGYITRGENESGNCRACSHDAVHVLNKEVLPEIRPYTVEDKHDDN